MDKIKQACNNIKRLIKHFNTNNNIINIYIILSLTSKCLTHDVSFMLSDYI